MRIWLLAGAVLIGLFFALWACKKLREETNRNKPGRRSVFYKWVVSYILFLVVSIVLCISIVVEARELLLQEYEAGSDNVRTVTGRLLDTYLVNAYNRQSEYVENETLAQLLECDPPYAGADRYLMVKLQKQMNAALYSLYADHSSQSYIYFHAVNAALNNETVLDNQLLMQEIHKDLAVEESELLQEIFRFHFRDFVVMPKKDGGVSILLMSSVPNSSLYTPKATVVQKLDDSFFATLLTDSTKQMGMYMYLVDSRDHVISASGSQTLIDAVLQSGQLPADGKQVTMKLNDGNYFVSVQNSNIHGWKYITLISPEAIADKVKALNRSAILLGLFSLCIGVIMAYLLARRQYRPVAQVISHLSDRFDCADGANEFELIMSAFNDIEEARGSIDHLYRQQTLALQKEFFAAALQSHFPGDAVRMAHALEIPTQNCEYFVVLISTYGAADNVDPLLDQALERCIEAVEKQNGCAYGLEMLDARAVVVAMDETNSHTSMLFDDLLSIIASSEWEAMLLAAASPVVQNINALNLCYLDACFALEEKRKLKQESNPLPRTLDISLAGSRLEAMDHVAKTIVTAVRSGNPVEAKERLAQLMKECPKRIEPIHYLRLAQLLSELFSCLPANVSSDADILRQSERMALRMRSASDSSEIMQILQEAICTLGGEYAKERGFTLMDKIIDCIEQHYTETDFNVSKLAEVMDMNMSYLSQHFREQSGVGLLEYINRLRVNRAKEIIQQRKDGFTFQQVAESVGFENLNSFIRVFKKYENITPGEFRKGKNIDVLG